MSVPVPFHLPRIGSLLAALALASAGVSCRPGAAGGATGTSRDVDCDLQIVSLPEELAAPITAGLGDPQRAEAAFGDLQKLIAAKRASLIGWLMLTSKPGQRAVVQQADEIRYWQEDPDYGEPQPGQPQRPRSGKFMISNAGESMVIDSLTVTDDQTIQIAITSKSTRWPFWPIAKLEKDFQPAPPGARPEPTINGAKVSITLRSGERKLIGVSKVPEPAGNVELFILRAETVKN